MRTARLTEAGRRELATLDRRSDDAAAAILAPLNPGQRTRLVTAMAEVERLMIASTVEVRECDPRHPDARFCLQTYYAELSVRFRMGYDPAVSPVADGEMTPPAGLLLVASLHGEPVGCGALLFYPEPVALVKRMWVSPAVRGLGLGRRILRELEDRARDRGVRLMRLETKDELTEAIRMYNRPDIARSPPSTTSRTPTTGSRNRSPPCNAVAPPGNTIRRSGEEPRWLMGSTTSSSPPAGSCAESPKA